jgi:GNAT superfamily N-acetyltransferase
MKLRGNLERICLEAAGKQNAEWPEGERECFLDKWLGRYLDDWPQLASVAVCEQTGQVAGYCVGCAHDVASDGRFADVSYFPLIAKFTPHYPAHLHINLAERWRGRSIGKALIGHFAQGVSALGAPGVHVVTGAGSRNRNFYARAGFSEITTLVWNDARIVMLGAKLPLSARFTPSD